MKKVIFAMGFLALTLSVSSVFAQSKSSGSSSYKAFKVDIMPLGYALPSGSGSKGGFVGSIEPKYNITDNIAVGIRYEAAMLAVGYSFSSGAQTSLSADVKAVTSFTAAGDYTFGTNDVRPFAGLCLGFYSYAAAAVTDNGNNLNFAGYSKFGFSPRAGVQAGHFRASVEYNIVGNYTHSDGTKTKNSYLGIQVGFTLGGGKK